MALPRSAPPRLRPLLNLKDQHDQPWTIPEPTRLFALPALRSMPFKVGVSLTEATLATWPREPDAVTLIELRQGTVQRISHATTEAAVRHALIP